MSPDDLTKFLEDRLALYQGVRHEMLELLEEAGGLFGVPRAQIEPADASSAPPAGPYGSRPIRRRRTAAEIENIKRRLFYILMNDNPMTVRQVFYQAVSQGVIDKTENEYKTTIIRLLTEMRLTGRIPFGWIADNTRWMRKPRSYSSLEEALRVTAQTYRRSLWANQDAYVEVWLEKDALAGVLYQVTEEWDIPLMVSGGYASLSFLHESAEALEALEKPAFIYYFGDHDPSGLDIPRNIEARLRELAPSAEIHFERVAVTPEQIVAWNLPTRPTKETDTRSRGFAGESVEVDAIHPDRLRDLVRGCIELHVDDHAVDVLRAAEASERQVLMQIAGGRT